MSLASQGIFVRISDVVAEVLPQQLLEALALGRGDGRYAKQMQRLTKVDLLILDDVGLTALGETHCRDLLEVLEERFDRRAILITSLLPMDKWHGHIGDSTLVDAILDRSDAQSLSGIAER